ncbi:uncharacterized protein LOC109266645 [Panthera pardus]|uniref:Uncharacterized protein LOC109266645 n=1 Tax=Panthera pardus TaxID=9691 RepID=A0A9V1FK33_PANPR|nr:uncharacterized protein LOC109266645 [Panthera pardus]
MKAQRGRSFGGRVAHRAGADWSPHASPRLCPFLFPLALPGSTDLGRQSIESRLDLPQRRECSRGGRDSFQFADSGPESRGRGELGHRTTAPRREPLRPGRGKAASESPTPCVVCLCATTTVSTTTTCWRVSAFVCPRLCLYWQVGGRGGGRCAGTRRRCGEEGSRHGTATGAGAEGGSEMILSCEGRKLWSPALPVCCDCCINMSPPGQWPGQKSPGPLLCPSSRGVVDGAQFPGPPAVWSLHHLVPERATSAPSTSGPARDRRG